MSGPTATQVMLGRDWRCQVTNDNRYETLMCVRHTCVCAQPLQAVCEHNPRRVSNIGRRIHNSHLSAPGTYKESRAHTQPDTAQRGTGHSTAGPAGRSRVPAPSKTRHVTGDTRAPCSLHSARRAYGCVGRCAAAYAQSLRSYSTWRPPRNCRPGPARPRRPRRPPSVTKEREAKAGSGEFGAQSDAGRRMRGHAGREGAWG